MTKVLLFGMDGAEPSLIFGAWLDDLPNIKKLMDNGCHARMTSTIPPNTIVAWNAMMSGRDTSQLGIFSYTFTDENGDKKLVSSQNLQCELIWKHLERHGKRGVSLFVPLSYPVQEINGSIISGFLTPGVESYCAHPPELLAKVRQVENPDVFFDVTAGLANHKKLDPQEMIDRVYEMTRQQLILLKDVLQNENWDFFMSVMLGTDRLQHMIWKHFDETHRDHIPNSPHKNAIKEYFIYLDGELGKILEMIPENTVVIVASDHGMVKQDGKINLNNWLIDEGYMVLKPDIDKTVRQRFNEKFVDMEKSVAWGGGAYNGRVFINKKVAGEKADEIRDEIAAKLKAIPDDTGKPLETYIYKAEEIYQDTSSPNCPDLTIYFDDLRWASNPDLGVEGLYSWKTAVGADSAGHSRQGCFIISGPGIATKGKMDDVIIRQVSPTVCKILNIPIPEDVTVEPLDVFENSEVTE